MATPRIDIKPEILRWACARSGRDGAAIHKSVPKLGSWLRGQAKPTLRQLEKFAKATYTPLGYLFLPEPPTEELPLPDLRTMRDAGLTRPSANLLVHSRHARSRGAIG